MRPASSRTTARLAPSGDQSAHSTRSSRERGAPPVSGTRASVPEVMNPAKGAAERDGGFPGRRDGQNFRAAQPERTRLRAFGAGGENLDGIAFPGRAVNDGLSIGSEARGANGAAAKGELVIDGQRNLRAIFAEVHAHSKTSGDGEKGQQCRPERTLRRGRRLDNWNGRDTARL